MDNTDRVLGFSGGKFCEIELYLVDFCVDIVFCYCVGLVLETADKLLLGDHQWIFKFFGISIRLLLLIKSVFIMFS